MKLLTLFLLGIFLVAVGYAVFGGQKFLTSTESLLDSTKNFLGSSEKLPVIKKAPELIGLASWVQGEPVTIAELEGKVVLVDFWTYTCINCIRNIPHIQALHEKYKKDGLVVLGIHTPEFEFEKDFGNVADHVAEYGITYSVAQDNEYQTWRAFDNRYWPALYLIDAEGNIRYTHFGEGKYAESEAAIQQLLAEAGLLSLDKVAEVAEPPASIDFRGIGTPEIYFGALRINNIGNEVGPVKVNEPYDFEEPERVDYNRFYLAGTWRIMPEFAQVAEGEGKVLIRYKANKLNMVLDTQEGKEVSAEVLLDGRPLGEENKGADIAVEDGRSFLKVRGAKLYNLVDTREEYGIHTLELRVPSSDIQFFTFTFG